MNPTNYNTFSTTTTTTTTGLFKLIERFPSVEIFDWSNLEKTTSRGEAIAFIQKHVPKDSLCVLVYKEAYGLRERVWKYVRAHLAAEFNVLIITPTKGVLSENGSDDTHGEFDDYCMLTLLTLLQTRATLYSHDNYRFRFDELLFSRIYMHTAFWEAGGKIRDEYCTDLKQDATLYLDINIAPLTQDQIPFISGSMIPFYRYSFQIPTGAGNLAVSMPTSPTSPPATPTTQPMLTSPTAPPITSWCKNGEKCRYLLSERGCNFKHPPEEVERARMQHRISSAGSWRRTPALTTQSSAPSSEGSCRRTPAPTTQSSEGSWRRTPAPTTPSSESSWRKTPAPTTPSSESSWRKTPAPTTQSSEQPQRQAPRRVYDADEYDEGYDDPPLDREYEYQEFDDDFSPIDACPNNCQKCRACKHTFSKRIRKKCKYSR